MISVLQRGRIRASYFDCCIAARRLEDTAKFLHDCTPEFKQSLVKTAEEIRTSACAIRAMLTPAEKRDLDNVFPLRAGTEAATKA